MRDDEAMGEEGVAVWCVCVCAVAIETFAICNAGKILPDVCLSLIIFIVIFSQIRTYKSRNSQIYRHNPKFHQSQSTMSSSQPTFNFTMIKHEALLRNCAQQFMLQSNKMVGDGQADEYREFLQAYIGHVQDHVAELAPVVSSAASKIINSQGGDTMVSKGERYESYARSEASRI